MTKIVFSMLFSLGLLACSHFKSSDNLMKAVSDSEIEQLTLNRGAIFRSDVNFDRYVYCEADACFVARFRGPKAVLTSFVFLDLLRIQKDIKPSELENRAIEQLRQQYLSEELEATPAKISYALEGKYYERRNNPNRIKVERANRKGEEFCRTFLENCGIRAEDKCCVKFDEL